MAISKYDIFLMLRAQDRASATLRRVSGDLRGLAGATGTADAAALKLQQRWEAVGRAGTVLRDTGRTARLFGIAAGGAVAFAAYQFAKLDSASSLAASQMGKVGVSFEQSRKNAINMRNAIVQTMRDSTSSTEDLTGAAYDLFSSLNSVGKSFLTARDGAKLLKLGSDAAIAGATDTRTATQALISVMNDFNIPASKAKDTLQLMFSAVRYGRMTFQDLAGSLGQTSAAASASGQSLQTMLGTLAFLTRRLPVRQAAVGWSRLTEIFARPQMLAGLKKLGVSITDTSGHLYQMPKIIDILVHKFPELTRGGVILQNFFKLVGGQTATIQARRAFTFLARQWRDYNTILGATTGNTTQFTKQLNLMNQSLGVRWAKFINRLKADMLDLGQRAIPALTKLAAPVERLVKAFEDLSPHTRTLIVQWTAYGAAIAIVGGSIAALVGGLMNLISIFGKAGRLTGLSVVVLAAFASQLLKGKDATDALNFALTHLLDTVTKLFHSFTSFATGGSGVVGHIAHLTLALGTLLVVSRRLGQVGLLAGLLGGGAGRGRAVSAGIRDIAGAFSTGIVARGMFAGRGRGATAATEVFSRTEGRYIQVAAQDASKLSRAFAGVATGISFIPGPLKIAGGLLGAAALTSYLWGQHQKHVHDMTKITNDELRKSKPLIDRIYARIAQVGRLPGLMTQLPQLNQQIRDLQKQVERHPRNTALRGQLADLLRQRRQVETGLTRGRRSIFEVDPERERSLKNLRQRASELKTELDKMPKPGGWYSRLASQSLSDIRGIFGRGKTDTEKSIEAYDKLNAKLAGIQLRINALEKVDPSKMKEMRDRVREVIQTYQDMGKLPSNIPQHIVTDIINAMIRAKKVLSAADLRAIVKTELDPASLRDTIQRLLRLIKVASGITVGGPGVLGIQIVTPKDPEALKKYRAQLRQARQDLKAATQAQKELKNELTGTNPALEAEARAQEAAKKARAAAAKAAQKAATDAANAYQAAAKKYEDMIQRIKTATQTLSSTFDQFSQQNKSAFGDFITGGQYFQSGIGSILMGVQQQIMAFTPNWKTLFSPQMVITAAKQQLDAFKRWRQDLAKATRGMPKEMAQALAAEGPQAAPILEAIMKMTPGQRRQLIGYWKNGQKAIQSATKSDMERQLTIWKSLGKGIVKNILAGMSEESAKMDSWLKSRALTLLKWLGQFDPNIEKAYERAREQYAKTHHGRLPAPPAGAKTPPKTKGTRRTQSVEGGGTIVNMTVNAHHTETLDQTMRRVDFRFRNRAAYLPPH